MWELDHKEGRAFKLEKTLQSLLDSKEIQPVILKGNQSWILIGRPDAEAPILRPPDANSQHFGKDPDAGKDWRQKENKATEDEMVGWHHWFNGIELGQTPENDEGHGSLVCCSPWGQSQTGLGDLTNSPILEVKRWGEVLCITSVTLRPFFAYSHRNVYSFDGLAPHNQQPCLISSLPFIKFLVILLHL